MNPTQQPPMAPPSLPTPPPVAPPTPPVQAPTSLPQNPPVLSTGPSDDFNKLKEAMPGNIASGVVSEVPSRPMNSGANGHKKELLNKMISNLLNKPGRSMHEIINGVKSAIGAYKNYAKEWDTLNGAVGAAGGAALGATASGAGEAAGRAGSGGIQKILQEIQAKKAQASPTDGGGGPGFQAPSSMGTAPTVVTPNAVNAGPNTPAPIGQMPQLPQENMIAGQPQTSSFNRPAPINNLGIFGH